MEKFSMKKSKTVFDKIYNLLKNRKTGLNSLEIAERTGSNWHSVRRTLGEMGTLLGRSQHATRGLLYSLGGHSNRVSMR